MYKTLFSAVLVVGLLSLTGRSSSAAPAPFTSPLIVAKGKLINQTAEIPTTAIFTPAQGGLYRLSVYATVVRVDPNGHSTWNYNFGWSDDAGPETENGLLFGNGVQLGQFQYGSFSALGGTVFPFEAKAGMPITYSVTNTGSPDNSAYSLYYTLERLE